MFDMSTGLPVHRAIEHSIVLKEGANPVSVRPYRYPQFQRHEIEGLIHQGRLTALHQPVLESSFFWLRRRMGRGDFAWITELYIM